MDHNYYTIQDTAEHGTFVYIVQRYSCLATRQFLPGVHGKAAADSSKSSTAGVYLIGKGFNDLLLIRALLLVTLHDTYLHDAVIPVVCLLVSTMRGVLLF